ncbi:hypothetical protein CF326_g7763 [Tilletia indica]|nr:hypothetical protein CF326_g7763 [Tilletia indica]
MAASRIIKWPTHLAITADIIMGAVQTIENSHTIESTIFDTNESAIDVKTLMWARLQPREGAYLVVQAPIATKPIRLNINDTENMRLIPEAFDGTNPDNDSLPHAVPFFTGTGVVKSVSPDRKKGTIGGWVFINKNLGWVEWEVDASFDDTVKWLAWLFPPPRTLVSFDGLLASGTSDGEISIILRRITTIAPAPQNLLASLSVGQGGVMDRAARIRLARAKANRGAEVPDVFSDTPILTSKVDDEPTDTPMKENGESETAPPAPKSFRNGTPIGPPSSPTPAPITRKRRLVE